MSGRSNIKALFLAKFDVRTGYTIEWSKTVDDSVSLKGLEFKSLPSGLHQTNKDVIAFVEDTDPNSFPDRLVYGVSVFHSNFSTNAEDEQRQIDRADVRMYSLGLLIDPDLKATSVGTVPMIWKPLIFTSGWEYVEDLEKVLIKWLASTDGHKDEDLNTKYKDLEDFFEANRHHEHSSSGNMSEDQMSVSSQMTSITATPAKAHHRSHHMLLSIVPLMENLGPLIFKVWKLALLRKKLLVHNAKSIESSCSFVYCISLISTIPQEVLPDLVASGANDFSQLQYQQPLFNVGVNDIAYLDSVIKKCELGFVACTTDEILLYKQVLYDYSLKLASFEDGKFAEVVASTDYAKHDGLCRATQRDLRRFRILYDEFDLYEDEEYCDEESLNWWLEVSEPTSWKEYIWKGFSWWASAGENDPGNREFGVDKEGLDNISSITDQDSLYQQNNNSSTVVSSSKLASGTPAAPAAPAAASPEHNASKDVVDVLRVVGYFQNMTVKIFKVLIDIVNNHEAEDSKDGGDADESEECIWIGFNDINEMGLDPYSVADHEFVVELVMLWWGKKAKVGNYIGNLCC